MKFSSIRLDIDLGSGTKEVFLKMGSPIEPGNLVSQGYSNFRITAWMTIIQIHTVLMGFAYPCETTYADFAWVYGIPHLNLF